MVESFQIREMKFKIITDSRQVKCSAPDDATIYKVWYFAANFAELCHCINSS